MTQITQGRYAATIRPNSGAFLVLVTRNGDCLHGMPSRSYGTAAAAERGARRMLAKVTAE